MATAHWNEKVSKNRGEAWKKNLVKGKLEAKENPTSLYKTRVKKLMPQNKIAATLKTSLATYGAIERGKRLVKKERAVKIAEILGVSTKSLFKEVDKDKLLAKN